MISTSANSTIHSEFYPQILVDTNLFVIHNFNEDHMNTILHFSTNIICFLILSGNSIFGNQELIINSLLR